MSKTGHSTNETILLEGLIRGEELYYRRLFDLYYRQLVIYANRLLKDEDLSRNVVQDAFVMIYEKRSELNIHTSLKAHLYQTIRNRCLNHIKRDKMTREHHQRIFEASHEMDQPVESLEYQELEKVIEITVENLPEQCQRIFKLSRFEGQTNQEIADQLSISKRTVETQISKALKRLRESLSKSQMLPPLILLFTILFV